jgi:AraC-like DNA-binding protein
MVVRDALDELHIPYSFVDLGLVEIKNTLSIEKWNALKALLLPSGLELMDDKKAMLIEKIKNVIIEMVHYSEEMPKVNYSDYISEKLGLEYTHMSKTFSEVKGTTIEQFIIIHKIERVKELLLYDEMSLTQISYVLNYSSVAHLSKQFKKVTGLTPSYFKQLKSQRTNLDKL